MPVQMLNDQISRYEELVIMTGACFVSSCHLGNPLTSNYDGNMYYVFMSSR